MRGLVALAVRADVKKSVREKDWRCRKHGTEATRARQSDLAGVTRARQCLFFETCPYIAWEHAPPHRWFAVTLCAVAVPAC